MKNEVPTINAYYLIKSGILTSLLDSRDSFYYRQRIVIGGESMGKWSKPRLPLLKWCL